MKRVVLMVCSVICLAGFPYAASAANETATAEVHMVDANGIGKSVGTITFKDMMEGLEITPNMLELPPGKLGFHIHENGSCEPAPQDGKMAAAQAAGGHYDPQKTGKHLGPDGGGHKGDLPALNVAPDGTAKEPVVVKNLTAGEIKGRTVIIHEGGDNYSDAPKALGGGGGRLACGVIQ